MQPFVCCYLKENVFIFMVEINNFVFCFVNPYLFETEKTNK